MKKHHEIFIAIKRIVTAVELRNSDLTHCCPLMNEDEEELELHLEKLARSQREISEAVQNFRDVTETRFKDFSNIELAFAVHIWSGIWSNTNTLRINSNDLMTIIGHNRMEDAADFITAMLRGKSPLFAYVSMHWAADMRQNGFYRFVIHNPDGLNRLILGNLAVE
jgi:hypothetical protein